MAASRKLSFWWKILTLIGHYSRQKWPQIKNAHKVLAPISCTVFHALTHDVFCIVPSVENGNMKCQKVTFAQGKMWFQFIVLPGSSWENAGRLDRIAVNQIRIYRALEWGGGHGTIGPSPHPIGWGLGDLVYGSKMLGPVTLEPKGHPAKAAGKG